MSKPDVNYTSYGRSRALTFSTDELAISCHDDFGDLSSSPHRQVASTRLSRCHSSCPQSPLAQLATKIPEKSSFSMSFRIICTSSQSVFCLPTCFYRTWTCRLPTTESSSPPAVAQTTVRDHWLSVPTCTFPRALRDRDRTFPLPRDARVVAPVSQPFQCPHTQLAEGGILERCPDRCCRHTVRRSRLLHVSWTFRYDPSPRRLAVKT